MRQNIIFNGIYQAIRNNIVTTELVLLFHKNITKLVFLWSNKSQKSFKVLRAYRGLKKILYFLYQKFFLNLIWDFKETVFYNYLKAITKKIRILICQK